MGTDDPTSPLHNPEGHMPTITDSDENEKRMDELVFDKRKKRMARGYTNLIGEERVTAAMQKVFCFMEAKEQREEKVQMRVDDEVAEANRLKRVAAA